MMSHVLVKFDNEGFTIEATLSIDGDHFCVGIGYFETMPYGFGRTISDAVLDYKRQVRSEHVPTRK
jgi:hypothetical protein